MSVSHRLVLLLVDSEKPEFQFYLKGFGKLPIEELSFPLRRQQRSLSRGLRNTEDKNHLVRADFIQ